MHEQPSDTNNPSVQPNNEQSSNYASAETSLNPSLTSSLSSHSLRNGDELIRSLSQNRSFSLVHDDDPSIVVSNVPLNHPLSDLTGPVKVVPSSTSSNALDKLLKLSEYHSLNGHEFQSLPPTLLSDKVKPTEPKENVKTIIEKTILDSINETMPKEKKEISQEAPKPSLFPATSSLLTSTASSSSPNPECSPFKLLVSELPAQNGPAAQAKSPSVSCAKLETTRSPNGSTINDAVALFHSESTKKANDKIIESLASLNHKEHEKADPILSASGKSAVTQLTGSVSVVGLASVASPAPQLTSSHMSPSKSTSALLSLAGVTTNMSVVPASSQEFCMGLNLNLAAAAAANAAAPIVVCDNTKLVTSPKQDSPTTQQQQQQQQNLLGEHQRFTSNASTSSIHNDLKMILEESKGQGSPTSPSSEQKPAEHKKPEQEKKPEQDKKETPKPQRQKHVSGNKNKHNKSKDSNKESSSSSSSKAVSEEISNMFKLMKLISENKGKSEGGEQQQPMSFRYSKEFLCQIKEERKQFIANFKPEVFESYCYCMTGKYWDPEKYFDVIQYDAEDRPDQHNHSYNNSYSKKKNYQNKNVNTSNNTNSYNQKQKMPMRNNKVQDGTSSKAPHCSPALPNSKEDADKTLLNMLKKTSHTQVPPHHPHYHHHQQQQQQPQQPENGMANIMEMLNKKPSNNILSELLPKKTPAVHTAQEVELESHLMTAVSRTPDHDHKLRKNSAGPSSCSSSCSSARSSNLSNCDFSNSSQAYKQLIINLSNHPLCTPPSSSRTTSSNMDDVLLKLSQKKADNSIMNALAEGRSTTNDGTNLLKQLLNLNSADEDKKSKQKRHHKHSTGHHHHKHGNSSGHQHKIKQADAKTSQFPAVNPHEKPFQNYQLEQALQAHSVQARPTPQSHSVIENLILKMNQTQNEQDHFSSLLNKMTVHPQPKPQPPRTETTNNSGDILKWFSGLNMSNKQHFSAKTLSEVELMSGNFP